MGGIVGGFMDVLGLSPEKPTPIQQPSPAEQVATSKELATWNAQLNRIDQYTPFSTTKYIQTPGKTSTQQVWVPGTPAGYGPNGGYVDENGNTVGWQEATPGHYQTVQGTGADKWSQVTELTPLGQQQLELMSAGQQQAAQLLPAISQRAQQMLTTDAGAGVQTGYNNLTGYGADATTIEAAYNDYVTRGSAEINKYFDTQRTQIEQKLYNQGISQTSDAYRTALSDFEKGRSDAVATMTSNALQSADARAMQAATFANQANIQAASFNNQSLAQIMNMRQAAVSTGTNLYSMLYNAGNGSTNMSAPQYAQVQGVDYGSIMNRDLAAQTSNMQQEWSYNKAEAEANAQGYAMIIGGATGGMGMGASVGGAAPASGLSGTMAGIGSWLGKLNYGGSK